MCIRVVHNHIYYWRYSTLYSLYAYYLAVEVCMRWNVSETVMLHIV